MEQNEKRGDRLYVIFFMLGVGLSLSVAIPYYNAEIRKQTAKAYSKGYFYGLDLQDKADVMLNGR
jgi:hypothetical protein